LENIADEMIIPVHMFAFANKNDRSKVRNVEIPDDEIEKAEAESVMNVLDLVFRYGQNDFQSKPFPSVSVGDVVGMYKGAYWMVMPSGWKSLTKEEFDSLPPPTSNYAHDFA
jgi:hypothetical protein